MRIETGAVAGKDASGQAVLGLVRQRQNVRFVPETLHG